MLGTPEHRRKYDATISNANVAVHDFPVDAEIDLDDMEYDECNHKYAYNLTILFLY